MLERKAEFGIPQIGERWIRLPASATVFRTYIPSNHAGSLKSSIENRDFNSEEETNFKRGAEGALEYFLPIGYITCHIIKANQIRTRKEKEKLQAKNAIKQKNVTTTTNYKPKRQFDLQKHSIFNNT